jgi:hypothetical protein
MFHHRDGARFPPGVMLGIQAKEFNLDFIRPENLASHGLKVLQVPFGKVQVGCFVPFTVASFWPLYHKGLIGGATEMGEPSRRTTISTEELWSSFRVTTGDHPYVECMHT